MDVLKDTANEPILVKDLNCNLVINDLVIKQVINTFKNKEK